ncbi:MAG TPA: NAD-dependent succinate-semialdehyde dehydrogenase [Polyangiaceae bacterium]|nr:NAD-dependent succinate-semialdehyde dehydrogenase [Polyangiaceae bacterium]
MRAIDPATGVPQDEHPDHDAHAVEARLAAAKEAFSGFRRTSFAERAAALVRLADLFVDRKQELAELAAKEMGKPVRQGRAEVEKCALACRFIAENAERFLADEVVPTEARDSRVVHEPLGPILAIMPWNYPYWQIVRGAASALMAGNVVLVKPAPGTPGCALALEALARRAGIPEGVLSVLLVPDDRIGPIIDDPRVAAVTLTGSPRAGRAVAARAGAALKKVVLELGGSDPYIVLADADVELAARTCVSSRLGNAGQACIAAKRIIVVPEVRPDFEARVLELVRRVVPGNPLEEATELGPLARVDLRDLLHRQVAESVKRGARLLLGGEVPERAGAWYPPTMLSDVRPGMPAFDEELFGPVFAVVPARDEAHAVELANETEYGLGAAVFTRDVEKGARLARTRLDAGLCFVNAAVKSDPRLPFGGVKSSGFGRELGALGIREFVNEKTLWVGQ